MLSNQHALKSIVYKNCEFGEQSLQELRNLIMNSIPLSERKKYLKYEQLESLCLCNVSISSVVQSELINLIVEAQTQKPLKKIKLSGFNLNNVEQVQTIKTGLFYCYDIEELDLSRCTIKIDLLAELL